MSLHDALQNWRLNSLEFIESGLDKFKTNLIKQRKKITFSISPEDEIELKQYVTAWRITKDNQKVELEKKRLTKLFEDKFLIPDAKDYQ